MLSHIIRKELLDQLMSLRFAIACVVCLVVLLLSSIVLTRDYREALSTFNMNTVIHRNEVTQRALGEAAQIVAAAEAYKAEEIAKANGETQRFLSVFEEYEKDKEVTRRRLYLQTMEEVLQPMEKVLIEESKGGAGVLPYLPLDQLKKGGTPTTNSNEGVER